MNFYLQRRAARSRPSRQRCLRRTAQSGYNVTSPFKSASKRRAAVKEDTTRTHFLSILFDCTTDTEHFSEHYQVSLKMLKKNAGIPFGSQKMDQWQYHLFIISVHHLSRLYHVIIEYLLFLLIVIQADEMERYILHYRAL